MIRSKRPNIKSNTISSYTGYINKLYRLYLDSSDKYIDSYDKPNDYKWLNDTDKINSILKKYKATTRKNIYNSIVVILDALNSDPELIKTYSQLRDSEHKEYETLVKNHTKTEKQMKNWVELKEIDDILKDYKAMTNKLYKKKLFKPREYNTLQEYITLLTYRNIPMRNDLAKMQVITPTQYKNLSADEKEENNFLVGTARIPYHFQINEYKTKKKFGKKKIEIPKTLNREIRKWLRVNKSGFYLTNSKGNQPITANGITKLLNKLFKEHTGKNVSTSMIRHIYLSDKYSKELEEKKKDAHNFGHSLEQQQDYIKK